MNADKPTGRAITMQENRARLGHNTEPKPDTLAEWLYQRFMPTATRDSWAAMDDDDRAYWEHHAAAVRRAVARGGFKNPGVPQ
jgi:hypothetical protein